MEQVDDRNYQRKRKNIKLSENLEKKCNNYNDYHEIDYEESFLSYTMTLIEPTIEEDESMLLKEIEEMNKNYKRINNLNKCKNLKENVDPNLDESENKKFIKRFQYLESKAGELGKPLMEMSLAEMDVFWNEAKKL